MIHSFIFISSSFFFLYFSIFFLFSLRFWMLRYHSCSHHVIESLAHWEEEKPVSGPMMGYRKKWMSRRDGMKGIWVDKDILYMQFGPVDEHFKSGPIAVSDCLS